MFKALSKKIATAAILSVVVAAAAQAQTVQYSTLYSFTNGGFGSLAVKTFGSGMNTASLTFMGQGVTNVTSPSFIDYGMVQATGLFSNTIASQNIYMEILQTLPSVGTATVVGTASGTISFNSSGAVIDWNQPSRFATIGTATYEVERLSNGFTSINAPTSGPQTIRGYVSASTVTPEPSTWALMGTGLLSVGGMAARRRRTVTA